jgi:hypothetical protein
VLLEAPQHCCWEFHTAAECHTVPSLLMYVGKCTEATDCILSISTDPDQQQVP